MIPKYHVNMIPHFSFTPKKSELQQGNCLEKLIEANITMGNGKNSWGETLVFLSSNSEIIQ